MTYLELWTCDQCGRDQLLQDTGYPMQDTDTRITCKQCGETLRYVTSYPYEEN